jgi:DNA-binding transcriptional regulator YiaG
MTWARVLQEVRPMRFEELYEERQRRTLTRGEAAGILGITERAFRCWSGRLAGITERAATNRYLMERFLPLYNERIW